MLIQDVVHNWFATWERGDFKNIPVAEDFTHTSPFGTIEGREAYLAEVEANQEAFLGFRFEIHDDLYEKNRACVRYTGTKDDFALSVSEWFYVSDELIDEVVSYYNIGE